MNKEDLEKEAEKYADGIYHYKINVSDYGEDGIINYRYSDVKEAYLASAEPREKRSELLEEKLNKAKEIIEGLMRFCRCFAQHHTEDIRYKEAEQFLF